MILLMSGGGLSDVPQVCMQPTAANACLRYGTEKETEQMQHTQVMFNTPNVFFKI